MTFKRGLFLCLDGLDGSGKSTQCRLLADWLRAQGRTVTLCYEPGSTALGEQLRAIVLQHQHPVCLPAEALLFMASRAQLVADVIRPALAEGQTIVCDRFELSTIVYQGHAGGLDLQQLREVGRLATGELEPDLTLVLDLPLEQARARRDRPADRLESRDEAYHQRVREGFLAEAHRRPDRIKVLDASATTEAVQTLIREEVTRVLATGPWA
ncbi:MAG: dTMP kinase [Planctomycetes bacterium]|nr:dTMP kinase [Planctomycetota bacterium]